MAESISDREALMLEMANTSTMRQLAYMEVLIATGTVIDEVEREALRLEAEAVAITYGADATDIKWALVYHEPTLATGDEDG